MISNNIGVRSLTFVRDDKTRKMSFRGTIVTRNLKEVGIWILK